MRVLTILVAFSLLGFSLPARAQTTPYVGQIMVIGSDFCPQYWLPADGQAVSRDDYSALFDVIGTRFGVGDGSTTFNLPLVRPQFAANGSPMMLCISPFGIAPS